VGAQRQATVAHGGHRWSWVVKNEVLGFEWRFGEESEKIMFFTLKTYI